MNRSLGLSIVDLISNGTISPQQGATLWAMVDEGHSFVVVAIPRFAGKSTLMDAVLGLTKPDFPIHRLSGKELEMERLKRDAKGGYLVVGEFSQAPVKTYIWGSPVRKVFDTLTAGYSLAAALHASGLQETFSVICEGNGVSDEHASLVKFMLYIRRFGEGDEDFWRRLSGIYEIDDVSGGKPTARLLHGWDEAKDQFYQAETSQLIKDSVEEITRRELILLDAVECAKTDPTDIAETIAKFY